MSPLLVVDHLTKAFHARRAAEPVSAVGDVSFALDSGRTLAIIGESGAGKSTVARMVLRLVEADSGSIVLDGVDVRSARGAALRALRRQMQIVFQDPFGSLDPRFTIARSIAEPLRVHFGMNRSDREVRVAELLDMVGLRPDQATRRPNALSGGQLQRVAIARALAVEPRLIVCDEPVAALDVSIRAQILNLLQDVQAMTAVSYLYITHDFATLAAIADDVLVMRHGTVVEAGPLDRVLADPQHAYTRDLVAAVPRIRTEAHPAEQMSGLDWQVVQTKS
jgi:oligopeptide transport system ATP-binding protein